MRLLNNIRDYQDESDAIQGTTRHAILHIEGSLLPSSDIIMGHFSCSFYLINYHNDIIITIIIFIFVNLGCCAMLAKYGTTHPKIFALEWQFDDNDGDYALRMSLPIPLAFRKLPLFEIFSPGWLEVITVLLHCNKVVAQYTRSIKDKL